MPRVKELIDLYYDTLTSTKSASHSERIQKSLPRNVLDETLADCLVNQFVILVCYDQVSRQLVQTVLKEDGLDPSKLLRHMCILLSVAHSILLILSFLIPYKYCYRTSYRLLFGGIVRSLALHEGL
jgi:hypothetical protein